MQSPRKTLFPLLGEGLRERVNLEGKKTRRYEGRLLKLVKRTRGQAIISNKSLTNFTNSSINETSLPSCPPVFCSSDSYPPQPSLIREGELPLFVIADGEADPQSQDSCNNNEITTLNASHSPRNDKLASRFTLHSALKKTYRPNALSSYRLKNKLFSRFTHYSSLKKRAAFTLAEVLITLGIIGVVAAMTIPTIISKIEDRQNIARWKKSYAVVNAAFNAVKADGIDVCATHNRYNPLQCSNGNPNPELDGGYYNPEFVTAFISKLKVLDYCSPGYANSYPPKCVAYEDTYVWGHNQGYDPLGYPTKILTAYANGHKFYYKAGALGYYNFSVQMILLTDGSVIYMGGSWGGPWIIVDVNGYQKGPNMVGKDLFGIQLWENKMLPSGAEGTMGYDDPSYGASGCSKDIGKSKANYFSEAAGAGCSAKYLLK